MEKLTCTVKKIIMHNDKNNFAIFLASNDLAEKTENEQKNERSFDHFKNKKDDLISVVGYFPIMSNYLRFNLYGKWKNHPKYGKQFSSESFEVVEPTDGKELYYFITSPLINCSYDLANRIKELYGVNFLNLLNNTDKIKKDVAFPKYNIEIDILVKNLKRFKEKQDALLFLIENGFDQSISSKIVFSNDFISLENIKKNPYKLIYSHELTWDEIDKFALKVGIFENSAIRYDEMIRYLLNLACNQYGHMFINLSNLLNVAKNFSKSNHEFKFNVNNLISKGDLVKDGKQRIYLLENYEIEKNLSSRLFDLLVSKPTMEVQVDKIDLSDFTYGDSQKKAIISAFENNVSIILGSAGTGKTTIVKKIVSVAKSLKMSVKLMAPTGRAAKRLSDVTGHPAKTMHLELGINKQTKQPIFNSLNTFSENLYVIDESSMADIKIFNQIVSAVPLGARLIIIGDDNQLPSVGPGTVLTDITKKEENFFTTTILDTIFRQNEESELLNVANNIKSGQTVDLNSISQKSDFKFFNSSNTHHIKNYLTKIITNFSNNKKYDILNDLQIIAPTNIGPLGVLEINRLVQDIVNPLKYSKDEIVFGNSRFRKGDKVIQTETNYDKKIVNGDQGIILSVNSAKKIVTVLFDKNEVVLSGEELFTLQLGYCCTVHKAQGGEFKFVIMVLHPSHGRLLNKKVLYTGQTRAKNMFVLLSTQETFNEAVFNEGIVMRNSTFVDRLKEARFKNIAKGKAL